MQDNVNTDNPKTRTREEIAVDVRANVRGGGDREKMVALYFEDTGVTTTPSNLMLAHWLGGFLSETAPEGKPLEELELLNRATVLIHTCWGIREVNPEVLARDFLFNAETVAMTPAHEPARKKKMAEVGVGVLLDLDKKTVVTPAAQIEEKTWVAVVESPIHNCVIRVLANDEESANLAARQIRKGPKALMAAACALDLLRGEITLKRGDVVELLELALTSHVDTASEDEVEEKIAA